MGEHCHRCHGELPARASGGERGAPSRVEDTLLFCPHCSAPQILLPDHMRVERESVEDSTGALPPPRLPGEGAGAGVKGQIEWRVALSSAGLVAVVGALLTLAGMKLEALSIVSTFWVMGASVLSLGLYTRRRPGAWVDGRVGLRIGLVTGLLLVAALGMGLALTGVIARFGVHRMGGLDALLAQQFEGVRAQMASRMQEQNQARDFQEKLLGFLGSPEVRGGLVLFYLGFVGGVIVLLSVGGGAFSGMLRGSRGRGAGLRQGDGS